jgi:indolepyruvate decarboxylase
MQDGPYNDLLEWNYARVPDVLGVGRGFVVETEQQLDRALIEADRHTDAFCILDVHLDPLDRSPALERLAKRLAKKL